MVVSGPLAALQTHTRPAPSRFPSLRPARGWLLQRKCGGGGPGTGGGCAGCREIASAASWDLSKIPVSSPVTSPPQTSVATPALAIGRIDDPLEDEADRLADHVMRGLAHEPPAPGAAMRPGRPSADGREGAKTLRSGASDGAVGEAPAIVHEVLNSPGQPLDTPTRRVFESRFGWDFSAIRVHANRRADESARSVGALAYTAGPHIVFAAGRYATATESGRHLLAHELAHSIQQGHGAVLLQRQASTDGDGDGAGDNQGTPTPVGDSAAGQAGDSTSSPAASPAPATKCDVDNFYFRIGDWDISWPGYFSDSTTIQLPVKFRVDLSAGVKKADCLIGQRKKGHTELGREVDDFPTWVWDGPRWWDGTNWNIGGNASWDWFGKEGADFSDLPGFPSAPRSAYPLYWGGVGKSGSFQFETYIADKATGTDVDTLRWEMMFNYTAPQTGTRSHT
jgi:Domain of unknown function (DUF4157)